MTKNINIIKFSFLKKHLEDRIKLFLDLNNILLNHLELAKYNKYDFDNYIRLFSFYLIFSELLSSLNKIVPFFSLGDLDEKDLTKDQREILLNFLFFLIKFWVDGLKFFVNYIYIEDHYTYVWTSVYFLLISFWLKIPLFLYIFQSILDIPSVFNSPSNVIDDIHIYLCNDDSLFFIFSLWYSHEIVEKDYQDWLNYKLLFKKWLILIWQDISPDFLYYMLTLLKESNKNISFKVERKDEHKS